MPKVADVGLNMLPRGVGGIREGTYVCFTPSQTRYCLSQDVAPPSPEMGKIAKNNRRLPSSLIIFAFGLDQTCFDQLYLFELCG